MKSYTHIRLDFKNQAEKYPLVISHPKEHNNDHITVQKKMDKSVQEVLKWCLILTSMSLSATLTGFALLSFNVSRPVT